MTKQTFRPGDLVNVTIRGARVVSDDGFRLNVRYGIGPDGDFSGAVQLPSDAAGLSVDRSAPAEWPPIAGDLWRDRHGDLWFAFTVPTDEIVRMRTATGGRWADGVDRQIEDNGPWALVRREVNGVAGAR